MENVDIKKRNKMEKKRISSISLATEMIGRVDVETASKKINRCLF